MITKQFEEMALAIDHAATRIGHIQSKMDAEGYFESSSLIEQLLLGDKEKLGQLESEARALAASIDEAVSNGDVEYGSEQWWSMYDSLQNVNDQIVEMKSNIAGFNDQLRQMEWDNFDYALDSVSDLVDENNFLIEVLESEHQLFEKVPLMGTDTMVSNGNWTDTAKAIQGLRVNNLETLEEQDRYYADELKDINEQLANDPNNKKLLDRQKEIVKSRRSIIKGITDEKQAIKSLIKEGYDTFLDYLQKSIDKRKQALEAQKSLYDYERTVADQTKAIASYRKQIAVLGGDDSEETRARMQELSDSLKKAEEDLQQTEYDRWLSDQEEMMDNMYESFENLINLRLDNLDQLIKDAKEQTETSGKDISKTIQEETERWHYDPSTTSFGVTIEERLADAAGAVHSVKDAIDAMINAANINANNELEQLKALAQTMATGMAQKANQVPQYNPTTGNSGSGGTNGSSNNNPQKPSTEDAKTKTRDVAKEQGLSEQIAKIKDLYNKYQKLADDNKKQANRYTPGSPNRIDYDKKASDYQKQADSYKRQLDSLEKQLADLQKGAYAKGGVIGNAIKKTGEDGIILARSGEEVLSLERVKQMQGIFKMMQPLTALDSNAISDIGNNTTVNGMSVSFALPNVTSYEDFVNKAKSDPAFEKLVQNMTIGTALGKSKLSKYSL